MASSLLQIKGRLLNQYPESQLETLNSAEIAKLKSSFPGIPNDFIRYLKYVGHGHIGKCNLMVYSGPVQPSDIYDSETAESLNGVVLVADDFSGYGVGYYTKGKWQIGEVNTSGKFEPLHGGTATFVDMIADRFLESI